MISKTIFWTINIALMTLAIAIAYVAGKRGNEIAALRQQVQIAEETAKTTSLKCGNDQKTATTRAAEAEARLKDSEAREKALRTTLDGWKTTAIRAGIVQWLGTHSNCSARAKDGHCSAYRLPDGTVLETDLPERVQ